MEAILSPLRPLSMTTAKRSPPSAVAERPSLTKVSAVKHAPPCETMDHTRPFQLSLVSRWRGPRLLLENRPELVNLHNCEGAQRRINPDRANDSLHLYSFSRHKQNNLYRSRCGPVWIASSLRSLAMTAAFKPHAAAGTSAPAPPAPENAPPAGRRISSPRRSAPRWSRRSSSGRSARRRFLAIASGR
jgi:hypothetical protein